MKAYRRVETQLFLFLTSALDGSEWSASHLCRFTPGERHSSTLGAGAWMGSRTSLDFLEKIKFDACAGIMR
jgi:hypothetical protein